MSSTSRVTSLGVSGLDIDQTVKDLMAAKRAPYDKMFQSKTLAEWKKASYNTMYNTISDFRTTVFNNKLQATLAPKTASSADDSVATVSANADAANISHELEVTQLAEGVRKTSSAAITTGSSKTTLADQFGISGSFDIKVANTENSTTVTVKSTDSIYDFVQKLNNAGAGVAANYDATLDRFFLSTTNTGANSGIDFTGSSTAGLNFLKDNLKIDTTAASGKNAKFSLDGVALEQQSNSFTISGVSYKLKATNEGSPIAVGVSADIDKTIENVKAFVDSYNTMLSKVNAALKETRYKDYAPLTSAQRADMTETEAKQWDAKAQSGMLYNDSILRQAVDNIRSDVSTPVSGLTGKYTSAAAIGITTGSYTEGGKLYIDETKLRTALTADPNAVYKIFGADGDSNSQDGITVRLYDTLKTTLDKIKSEAGVSAGVSDDTKSVLAKQINQYTDDMADLSDRLDELQDKYYNQFSAMETALSKMANQSSWLSSMLGTSSN
ncbi:MAG: flagellar filament capping protein FliD [Veillonellaceae bacterium]|nr:flagellar filament capping protein FliD [Veillonellaceae bacterium]